MGKCLMSQGICVLGNKVIVAASPNVFLFTDENNDGKADIAGRRDGIWLVGVSTGTAFEVTPWGRWSTAVTWLDVFGGDLPE